jgi:hypothetical protein
MLFTKEKRFLFKLADQPSFLLPTQHQQPAIYPLRHPDLGTQLDNPQHEQNINTVKKTVDTLRQRNVGKGDIEAEMAASVLKEMSEDFYQRIKQQLVEDVHNYLHSRNAFSRAISFISEISRALISSTFPRLGLHYKPLSMQSY